mgnify:CR=1 FL=1
MSVSEHIAEVMRKDGKRFWASDNISEYVSDDTREALIEELTEKFGDVLDTLLIDQENDPNSEDTARRMAKMYYNEIMTGRYDKQPKVTSFPNDNPDDRYAGILTVRAEIKSMCSHHHQPVRGIAIIGLLPGTRMIGLSKYARIAQWLSRRGTLQEELTRQIAEYVMKLAGTEDVGVYIQATHGCMENRGVCAHSSLTQSTVVHGQFFNPSVKNEWMDHVKNQLHSAGAH